MIIITDNIDFSNKYFPVQPEKINSYGTPLTSNFEAVFLKDNPNSYQYDLPFWKYGILTDYAEDSQFDLLMKLAGEKTNIPDKTFCLAGHGKKFHGFRNRHWESREGNIHLSCYFKPYLPPAYVGLGFTMLAAVSVVDTLNEIPELKDKAKIKWVNDIIVNDSKICGVIAQTQIQGDAITDAVIGIGLNVEAVPQIESTSFVPSATSINAASDNFYTAGEINLKLLANIEMNYKLLSEFGLKPILDKYIQNSMIIGKNISVWSDPHCDVHELINSGKVVAIGDFLELYLEGQAQPVTSGRIVID
jgi:BirA family transcriptional regulator, biotin operon repressor / biotin---[acetyl-CoA-carboxylase] ligase